MKINILGTEYTIKTVKISECEMLQKEHWAGCCSEESKEIIVADMSEELYFPYTKQTKIDSIEEIYEGYEDIKLFKSKKYGNTTVCYYKYSRE